MTVKVQSVKQCVVLSGKGGTGKTSLSAGLMHLSSLNVPGVYVDADVDASNLALVTAAIPQETHEFSGSKLAVIDPNLCSRCGTCFDICRYEAILKPINKQVSYQVIDLLCDGCAACVHACPEAAIRMVVQQDGEWYHSTSPYGHLFHAELFPAAENTGKLVTTIKQAAISFSENHQIPLIFVDGPPGIGCPVISASTGADLALLVAEPGVSGKHDLERIIQTLEHLKIPILICINKFDIYPEGTDAIKRLANSYGYQIIGEIPFDDAVPNAMIHAKPVTEFAPESPASLAIQKIFEVIMPVLFSEEKTYN